jgi:glucosamine kinase
MSIVVVIDGGGTSTVAAAFRSGAELYRTEWPSYKPEPEASKTDELCRSIGTWLASIAIVPTDVALVVLGMSGVWSDREKHWYSDDLTAAWEHYVGSGMPRMAVMSDVELVQLAALGASPGVVMIAGTGVMAVGVSAAGQRVRVGGWGPRIDDAGGGFWMGRQALRAVALSLDGRGPQTLLIRPVAAFLRCDPEEPWALQNALRTTSITSVARLAQAVCTYAAEGDRVAVDIRDRAANELGHVLRTARAAAGAECARTVIYGSLFLDSALTNLVFDKAGVASAAVEHLSDVVGAAYAALR